MQENAMRNEDAILSNEESFSIFYYNGTTVKFKTSPKLQKYTKMLKWNKGYIEVMAQYSTLGEVEEYIDLRPILVRLYIDSEEFLKNIRTVRIKND